jgi:hypothetical protein
MANDTKPTDGPKRERLAVDTEPILNRALELRVLKANLDAARRGVPPKHGGRGRALSKSDVVNDILRRELAAELAELESQGGQAKARRKS